MDRVDSNMELISRWVFFFRIRNVIIVVSLSLSWFRLCVACQCLKHFIVLTSLCGLSMFKTLYSVKTL
jgi:hypothetical protein